MRDFAGHKDQFVDVAQLGDGRGHDPGESAAEPLDFGAWRAQQVVFQFADGQRRDGRKRRLIDVVVDAHDRIDLALVIGQRVVTEVLQRQTGQDRPRCFALRLTAGCQPGIAVAGLAVVGGAEQFFQAAKRKFAVADGRGVNRVRPRRGHGDRVQRGQGFHGASPWLFSP